MDSSQEKKDKLNFSPPRDFKVIPRDGKGITSRIEDIPPPSKNEFLEKIKNDISSLEYGKCLKFIIPEDKSLIETQRYISTVCFNYSRKLQNSIKFTVQAIDEKTIGVWRINNI